MDFKLITTDPSGARAGVITTGHGAIETPIWIKMAFGGDLPAADILRNSNAMEDARAASEAATPVGHAGVPEDIAAGVVYLASDDARFITGTELIIDGGMSTL